MLRSKIALPVAATIMMSAGFAWATAPDIEYTPDQLVKRAMPHGKTLPPATATKVQGKIGTDDCELWVTATEIQSKDNTGKALACDALWKNTDLTQQVSITFVNAVPLGPSLKIEAKPVETLSTDHIKLEGDKLTFTKGNPPANSLMVYFTSNKEWKSHELKKNPTEIPSDVFGNAASARVYVNFDKTYQISSTWNSVDLETGSGGAGGGAGGGGGGSGDGKKPTVTPNYEGFCNVENPNVEDTKYIVCLDLYEDGDGDTLENGSGGAFRFFPETRGHILLPNRAVVVRVRHARGTRVSISMDGKRGLSKGIIDNRTPEQVKAEAQSEGRAVPTQIYSDVVSEVSFGPRLPGESDIKVVLENVVKGAISTYRTEVTVEELYIGAFRLGLGPVFQGAVERSYAAEVMPGSQQAQIVAKTSGTTDLELVLGFAPYLLDYYQRGGRASISRRTSYIAPYVGLGLVNAKENSLELLKSLHLGVELELSPGFSFATTFVMRRVTRLADGYHVGMPVNGPDVPTTTGYNWGWGLVANFSPEFFKVATTSSSKFFK